VQPDDRVDPNPDPRFPRSPDAEPHRRGIWVEQPRSTGPVGSTELANSVADELADLETRCCGDDAKDCRGLEGRLLMEFELATNGRVVRVETAETTLYDDDFRSCLSKVAADWRLVGHSGSESVDASVPIRIDFSTGPGER